MFQIVLVVVLGPTLRTFERGEIRPLMVLKAAKRGE
jgi:hypothetical protein